jgi:hypothetical protein
MINIYVISEKLRTMKRITIYVLFLALFMFSCQQGKVWESSQAENTIESYQKYLTEYPDGKYADSAKIKIEQIEWNIAYEKAILETEEVILTTAAAAGTMSVVPYGREKIITIFNPKIIDDENLELSYVFENEAREDLILMAVFTGGNIAAMIETYHYFGTGYEMLDKSIKIGVRVTGKSKVTLYFLTPEDNRLNANKSLAASNVISLD